MKVSGFFRLLGNTVKAALFSSLLISASAIPSQSLYAAEPNCNPQSMARRAVAGDIVNRLLGGFNRIVGAAAGVNNGISPTPSSAMEDCIVPRLSPPPPAEPRDPGILSAPPRPGTTYADPHFYTLDGLHYGFQAAGDYALVQSTELVIQARYFRRTPQSPISVPLALAIKIGSDVVVINDPADSSALTDPDGPDALVSVNGIDIPIDVGGWIDVGSSGAHVQKFNRSTYLNVPETLSLIMQDDGSPIQVVLDGRFAGTIAGLLGNFDDNPANDLRTQEGAPVLVSDTDQLYGDFLQSWLRQGDNSLFNTEYIEAELGSIVPTTIASIANVDDATRTAAAERCMQAGVSVATELVDCTFDLVFDDNPMWLEDAVIVSNPQANSISAAALTGTESAIIALPDLAAVRPGQPSLAAGSLSMPYEVDQYRFTVASGSRRRFITGDICSASQPLGFLVEVSGMAATQHTLLCEQGFELAPGQATISVFSPVGETLDYSFSIIEPVSFDLGVIALDFALEGMLGANQTTIGTLPSRQGDRVYITAGNASSCASTWQLIDGAGSVIAANAACRDLGLQVVSSNTPYQLMFDSASNQAYGFEVISVGENVNQNLRRQSSTPLALTIATAGQQASASFPVDAAERFYIETVDGPYGNFVVLAADGSEVVQFSYPQDSFFTAVSAGNYTLAFNAADALTGTANVIVHRVPADSAVAAALGDTVNLSILAPGQKSSVELSLAAGQRVYVNREGVRSGRLAVMAPDSGEIAGTFLSQEDLLFQAAVSGVYTVTLTPTAAFTGIVPITLTAVADDIAIAAAMGDTVDLSITTPGQKAVASFELAAGENYVVSVVNGAGPRVILQPPGDSPELRVIAARAGTASVAGTYSVMLSPDDDFTGTVTIRIADN